MNTVTIIWLLAAVILYVAIIIIVLKVYRRTPKDDKTKRRIIFGSLIAYLFAGCLFILTGLNIYGLARLPVLNEVKKRFPESYIPAELAPPPSQGKVQSPSKPTFDEHKEQMEKLKRDGL